ncbi:MAG: 3-carboxymuconate cyclase [Verrucomicrobiales bacterium]|nr:3-carboxymuconate cyclase [Verrucomicrobiales bacterium]
MSALRIFPLILLSGFLAGESRGAAAYEILHQFAVPGAQPMAGLVPAGNGELLGTTVGGGAFGKGTVYRFSPGGGGAVETLVSFSGTGGAARGAAPVAGLTAGAGGWLYGTASEGGAGGFGNVFRVSLTGGFEVLLDFTGTGGAARGSVPGALLGHADGNFYGVTQGGGTGGSGTVFKITPAGAHTVLADFTGSGGAVLGAGPRGGLVAQGNVLYGVTESGGAGGFGTLFKITTAGAWTLMADLTGVAGARPGAAPQGGLHLHTDGLLYGATASGGTSDQGTIFRLSTAAAPVFTVLRHAADATGSQPNGNLVRDAAGVLYGTTASGGSAGVGTVYKITTAGVFTLLASLDGVSAAGAAGGLAEGTDGNFYGVSEGGGRGNRGGIFRVTPAGGLSAAGDFGSGQGWFPSGAPVEDGAGGFYFPLASGGSQGGGVLAGISAADVIEPVAGFGGTMGEVPAGGLLKVGSDFYGLTARGGASSRGTAFRWSAGGGLVLLSGFTSTLGSLSEGGLIRGADGALYGVSREGGSSGRGTIFKLTLGGVRTRLISFTGTAGAAKGQSPRGPLAMGADGNFYGVAERGGAADAGVIFRLNPDGAYTILTQFTAAGPRWPLGGLTAGTDGKLYGTTSAGGAADAGTLIRLTPAGGAWAVVGEFTGTSGAAPGSRPLGTLTAGPAGAVTGLTAAGGAADRGVTFRYDAAGGLRPLVEFSGESGATPGGGVADLGGGYLIGGGVFENADGSLLGVTPSGGSGGGGVVFRLTPAAGATDFTAWRLEKLGNAAAPFLGDPDADGVPILLEYALGLDPMLPDAGGMPAATLHSYQTGDSRLRLMVHRDPGRPDVDLSVEAADAPAGPWTVVAQSLNGAPFSGAGYFDGETPGASPKTVEIRDIVPLTAAAHRFLRVKAGL